MIPASIVLGASVAGAMRLSCPASFDTRIYRGGNQQNPCELKENGGVIATTPVYSGDRLKVAWASMSNAGGFTRLSLVPEGQETDQANFDANVMKTSCYGYDQRDGKTAGGTCVHPCDSRKPCEYQASKDDKERYDTTVGIPYNLKPGFYVMQAMFLVGEDANPYMSCARIQIKDGDNTMGNCQHATFPKCDSCLQVGEAGLDTITTNTTAGEFCYSMDGAGDVDADIATVPVNVNCAGGKSCALATRPELCDAEDPSLSTVNAKFPRAHGGDAYAKCEAYVTSGKWQVRSGEDAMPEMIPKNAASDANSAEDPNMATCLKVPANHWCNFGKTVPGSFMNEGVGVPKMTPAVLKTFVSQTDNFYRPLYGIAKPVAPPAQPYVPPATSGGASAGAGGCNAKPKTVSTTTATTTSTYV